MQRNLELAEEEKQVEQEVDDRDQLKKTINNLMNDLDNPSEGLNYSQIEDPLNQHQELSEDRVIENNVSEEIEKEEEKQAEPLQKSEAELTFEEKERIKYLEDLQKANIKDLGLAENLKYMMEVGYTNFELNHQLLKRNNNDLAIAINLLCNGIVSDSMFGEQ